MTPLDVLRDVRVSIAASLIAIKPHLDDPYPEDPRWTPWTRFVERELRKLDDMRTALAQVEALVRAAESVSDAVDEDAKMGYPLPGESCTYAAIALSLDEALAPFQESRDER